jgi:hypothetical protein
VWPSAARGAGVGRDSTARSRGCSPRSRCARSQQCGHRRSRSPRACLERTAAPRDCARHHDPTARVRTTHGGTGTDPAARALPPNSSARAAPRSRVRTNQRRCGTAHCTTSPPREFECYTVAWASILCPSAPTPFERAHGTLIPRSNETAVLASAPRSVRSQIPPTTLHDPTGTGAGAIASTRCGRARSGYTPPIPGLDILCPNHSVACNPAAGGLGNF